MAKKNDKFTIRLIDEIKESGLDRPEFAERCKIGYSTLMNYLNKKNIGRVPEWHILLKLSKGTNRTIDWLLTGEQPVVDKIDLDKYIELKEYMHLSKKYTELLEESNRLKDLLITFDKVLEACGPPEDMEERRLCRLEYKKFFKMAYEKHYKE